jgi:hypothetical protein
VSEEREKLLLDHGDQLAVPVDFEGRSECAQYFVIIAVISGKLMTETEAEIATLNLLC